MEINEIVSQRLYQSTLTGNGSQKTAQDMDNTSIEGAEEKIKGSDEILKYINIVKRMINASEILIKEDDVLTSAPGSKASLIKEGNAGDGKNQSETKNTDSGSEKKTLEIKFSEFLYICSEVRYFIPFLNFFHFVKTDLNEYMRKNKLNIYCDPSITKQKRKRSSHRESSLDNQTEQQKKEDILLVKKMRCRGYDLFCSLNSHLSAEKKKNSKNIKFDGKIMASIMPILEDIILESGLNYEKIEFNEEGKVWRKAIKAGTPSEEKQGRVSEGTSRLLDLSKLFTLFMDKLKIPRLKQDITGDTNSTSGSQEKRVKRA